MAQKSAIMKNKVERRPRAYDPVKQLLANSLIEEMNIPIHGFEDAPCVYKLSYNSNYLIIKGKSLSGSLFMFKKGYSYYVGYDHGEATKHADTLYIKFYNAIKRNPGHTFSIEIIAYGTPYQLLKAEQLALDDAIYDDYCLNSNVFSYMPKWNPKTKNYGGWIPKSDFMNYKKYMKNTHL
jgi:hypothetical protein